MYAIHIICINKFIKLKKLIQSVQETFVQNPDKKGKDLTYCRI